MTELLPHQYIEDGEICSKGINKKPPTINFISYK